MKVNFPKLKCSKCKHSWRPRKEVIHICPKCKTPLSKNPPEVLKGDKEDFIIEENENKENNEG